MKIVIFGDSISEGIGQRKNNYVLPLQSLLEKKIGKVEICNKAHTGTTVKYMADIMNEEEVFDFAIIGYGNVDAMLRPDLSHKPNLYKYLPSRYKQNGMLNPRPYYSHVWYKKAIQHIDSAVRWNLNRLLLSIQGTTTWVSEQEFRIIYKECIERLVQNKCKVILLSTVKVKDRYFPGTNKMYSRYNDIINNFSEQYENCYFIDLYNKLDKPGYFFADGFHPNEKGYSKMAQYIFDNILLLNEVEKNE